MPLSEHEQKILDEIEKSLYEQDPKFARGVRKQAPFTRDLLRARNGALVFLIGVALLIAFFVSGLLVVGVAAFATMVAGVVILSTSFGGMAREAKDQAGRGVREAQGKAAHWQDRLRERFRRQ